MPLDDLILPNRAPETVPSETVRITLGIYPDVKKVGLEFSTQIKTIRLEPDRVRKLAIAMLQCADAIDPPVTS